MPVVKVAGGRPGGDAHRDNQLFIAGNDLSAGKARILLMASMLSLGALPPASDPSAPTADEITACRKAVAAYQAIFDTH
jgi:hypothetical protein